MVSRMSVIGMHVRPGVLIMHMDAGCITIVSHHFVVVLMLCRRRQRRTLGHRRGSEALERHRQQRHPDDQDFHDGFHAPILAQVKAWAISALYYLSVRRHARSGKGTRAWAAVLLQYGIV